MAQLKKIGMAAGTFSAALGIGFLMQNGDALANRFGGDTAEQPARFASDEPAADVIQANLDGVNSEPAAEADIVLASAEAEIVPTAAGTVSGVVELAQAPTLPTPEPALVAAVQLPAAVKVDETPEAPIQLASVDPEVLPDVETDVSATTEIDCVPTMMAVASEAATVELAIGAPCHLSSAFTIHHQGMMFTAMTNDAGAAKITVPALAEVAVMIAAFENGDGAVATATVPDFASYDRAVLQWQGETSVMLSAYEDGAQFGDPAHIHSQNPGDLSRVAEAEGGFLIKLGEPSVDGALMAEVYTYPTGMVSSPLDVMIVAEAEITENNCGQDLAAQSIQVSPDGEATALDLEMVMPACDAVGDFLILQNMFEDLTLAAR